MRVRRLVLTALLGAVLGLPTGAARAERTTSRPIGDWLQYNPYSFNIRNHRHWLFLGWDFYGLSGRRQVSFPYTYPDPADPSRHDPDCSRPSTPTGGFHVFGDRAPRTTGRITQRTLASGDVELAVEVRVARMPVLIFASSEVAPCAVMPRPSSNPAIPLCANTRLEPIVRGTLRYELRVGMRLPPRSPIPWLLFLANGPYFADHVCACRKLCPPEHRYEAWGLRISARGSGTILPHAANHPELRLTPGKRARIIVDDSKEEEDDIRVEEED